MRLACIGIFLAAAVSMSAQAPAQKLFTSAADVTAMMNKAKKERKPDQANFNQPLLVEGPYRVNLESRVHGLNTPPNLHQEDAELVYVVDGSGTLTTGGKLRDEKKANGMNLTGTGIDGGTPQHIAKGDFVMIPAGVAHSFTDVSDTLVIMSLHMPKGTK